MKSYVGAVFFFGVLASLISCGYRFTDSSSLKKKSTISVPYIKGDLEGKLTAAVIKAINASSKWTYTQGLSDLVLEGEIIEQEDQHVGYQYDTVESTGALINRLVPNEGRRAIVVRLQLFNSEKKECLYGPYEVKAHGDYDFVNFDTYKDLAFVNQQGQAQSVLTFSLGQLVAWEGAREAALSSAYQMLAEQIVTGLENL